MRDNVQGLRECPSGRGKVQFFPLSSLVDCCYFCRRLRPLPGLSYSLLLSSCMLLRIAANAATTSNNATRPFTNPYANARQSPTAATAHANQACCQENAQKAINRLIKQ